MAKKKQRAKQVSKGEIGRNRGLDKASRRERDLANPFRRVKDQFAAYKAGKQVKVKFLLENNLRPLNKVNVRQLAEMKDK